MKSLSKIKRLSFSRRLFFAALLINFLGAVVVIVSVGLTERAELTKVFERGFEASALGVKQSLAQVFKQPEDQHAPLLETVLPSLTNSPLVDYLLVTSVSNPKTGVNWSRKGGENTAFDVVDVSEVRRFLQQRVANGDVGDYRMMNSTLLNEAGLPAGNLLVGFRRDQVNEVLMPRLRKIASRLALVFALQMLIVAWALGRFVTKPMQRIQFKLNKVLDDYDSLDKRLGKKQDLKRIERGVNVLSETLGSFDSMQVQLTTVLDSVHDAVIVVDQMGHILSFNRACRAFWGYKQDELHSMAFGDLVADRYRRINEEYIHACCHDMLKAGDETLTTTAVSHSGEEFPIEVLFSFAVLDGQERVVLTVQDISEQEAQKQALIVAKENAEASEQRANVEAQTKANFLATMSHEIRTPMNGVVGVLDLLNGTVLNSEQGSLVETAIASSESLLTVLNDILDFSKLDAGKVGLESTPFDLGRLVEDVSILFSAAASEKRLALNCSVDPQLNEKVVSDPTRLRQILSNLVGNAIKFTREGEVNVRLRVVYRGEDQAKIQIEVQDTGIGIPKDLQGRLFMPFNQADASTTREFGGTGLGLAISKQLTTLLGGTIWFESEYNEGTRFFLELDMALSGESVDRKLSDKALHNLRVLVVDDNRTNRSILRGYFSHWGVQATIMSSSLDALEELKTKSKTDPYDVCLTDYYMPEMDGLKLAEAIQRDPNLNDLEVVMLSSGMVDREQTDKVGIRWLMSKPIRQSALMEILAVCIDEETALEIEQRDEERHVFEIKALLVEDNPTNQLIATQMLRRLGAEVVTAENGAVALESMSSDQFDIVFMDCQMPVMDGYEATTKRRSLEQQGLQKATIIALTANALEGDQQRCLDAGMDDYVAKPFREENLRHILSKWL